MMPTPSQPDARTEVERFLATLPEQPVVAVDVRCDAGSETVNLIRAWAPERRDAELLLNSRSQASLERQASRALHHDVDIASWGRLTRRQIALAVERVLNTEVGDTPLGDTVKLTSPLGRPLEYVRTPGGWERLRPLPGDPGPRRGEPDVRDQSR
jgi:hypothetical protein